MRTFVPNAFKKKGHGWNRKLNPKEKKQHAKYSQAFTMSGYQSRAGK